jgi:hypothetical protein
MSTPRTLAAAFALVLAGLSAASAAPRAEPWPRWERHDPASRTTVDHAAWDAFLRRHVQRGADGIHRLPYGAIGAADRAALEAYLARLQATPVSALARAEQRALWINFYNAATVQVVLRHYPVASIRDIDLSPGLFARGPWGARLWTVEGEKLSLDDIEHRILRPLWRDPRTHYALNCASLGCPNLAARAYTAAALEAMLDEGARAFVNHPRGASVEDGRLAVSSLYDWFADDFGGDRGVLAHLKAHAAPPLAAALAKIDAIDDDAYDWALNDAR